MWEGREGEGESQIACVYGMTAHHSSMRASEGVPPALRACTVVGLVKATLPLRSVSKKVSGAGVELGEGRVHS